MNRCKALRNALIPVVLMLATSLSAVLVYGASQPSARNSAMFSQEQTIPSRIMPTIIVAGSNREMGYQYGYQLAAGINASKSAQWVFALNVTKNDPEKVIYLLKGMQYYIEKTAPETIDWLIGMAEGATDAGYPMHYIDTLVINIAPWIEFGLSPTATYPAEAKGQSLPPKQYRYISPTGYQPGKLAKLNAMNESFLKSEDEHSCSRWAAWGSATKSGKMVIGDSCDQCGPWPVTYVAFPKEGYPFIATGAWPGELYRHPGMNNQGFYTSGGYLPTPREIDKDFGLVPTLALRHLTQLYSSAAKAKQDASTWKYTGQRVHNWLLIDTDGVAYVSELTAAVNSWRKPGDFGEKDWIAAMNAYIIPSATKTLGVAGPERVFQEDPRMIHAWIMLNKYAGKIDLEFAKMLYRHTDVEKQTLYMGHGENDWITLSLPDKGDKGVRLIATGPIGKNKLSTFGGGIAPRLQMGTDSFFTLSLRSSPSAVVEASLRSAEDALRRAGAVLKLTKIELNSNMAVYLLLSDKFSKAQDELYRGRNYLADAQLANGDEMIFLYSKSLGAFTRAEAQFMEIRNLLKPPPTSPEDIGLTPIKPPRPGDFVPWQ